VDNEGETTTREVCESFADRLPLRYLVCRTPGQNAARNYGLGAVRGELVVLSDDDMLPDADWLRELYQGAKRWPEHVLFGGRSLPNWPGKVPDFEIDEDIGHWTYCICDPPLPEGPDPRFLPISTNMAIRRRVFDYGLTFDESIGPNGRDYAMGSETEFNLRLGRLGFAAVFLPKAVVHNVVQAEQLDRNWVLGRAFREGRGETRLQAPVSWCDLARLTKRALWATARYSWGRMQHRRSDLFRRRISCALTHGRLYEAWRLKLGLR